ncbi:MULTISPECIES: hypothetical protein [unclassified Pseudomonas]|uniref:hypothetical protein n=1 Tax=unclassified Pseudomonas TaxID=196821 RepID=UPI001CC0FA12|nr:MULTISPECIES: hypothetical protein [unclassified Pseudomonas]
MKQYRGLIIFIATMVSSFVLVQVWHKKAAPEEKKQELERQYDGIAHVMNADPPPMPDDSIRLDHIRYGDGVLHIPFTLTKVTKSEIDVDAFTVERKELLVTASCGEKGLGPFVKSGLVVNYTFSDSSNLSIADFKIGQSDCQ